jgi:hypothetical protein
MSGHVPAEGDYEFAAEIDALPEPIEFWHAAGPTTSHDQHVETMKHQIATAAATAVAQISEMDVDAGSPAGAAASAEPAAGERATAKPKTRPKTRPKPRPTRPKAPAGDDVQEEVLGAQDCPKGCKGNCPLCREYTKWKNKKDGVDKTNYRRKEAAKKAGREEWDRVPALGTKINPRWKETAAYRADRLKNNGYVNTFRKKKTKMGAAFTDLSVGP